MKKILLPIVLLFSFFQLYSQNAPIDFENPGFGSSWTWTVFENDDNPPLDIIANPNSSGINTSSTIAKFTARQAGQPWAGCESSHGSDIGSFSFDTTNCTIKIMVYKNKISDVGIKFVDSTGAAQPEIKVANTLINQWEELTFDFSSRIGIYPVVKDQIVIFPDFDLSGRANDETILFDNITFSSAIPALPDPIVTFQVDMNNVTAPFTIPEVNGTFNGWCGNCWAMSDANNDNIWDLTTSIPAGFYEYKFAADSWSIQESLTIGSFCTQTNGIYTNRIINITGDTVLPVVCWESCIACPPVGSVSGCTDSTATNYNPLATVDDGSCTYVNTLAQIDLPITWDDTSNIDYTVTPFGGAVSSLSQDPLNSSNTVLMTDRTAGSQTWAGTTLSTSNGLASTIPFVQGATTISAHVYSPASGVVVRLKAEDHTNPGISVETEATTTISNGWNTLVFDFANEANGTAAINFSNTYDKLSIFFDFGNSPSASTIYYLDSVYFGGMVSGVNGCTDPTANNYNSSATIDDGSCMYDVTFTVDLNCESFTPGYVAATGPTDAWSCGTYALSDADTNGVWEGTFSLPAGTFEYIYCADGWAQNETAGLIAAMQTGATCAPVTDYSTYANRLITVGAITTVDTWGSCTACTSSPVSGCTDSTATNYNPLATVDDGSCTYPTILTITTTVCNGASSVQMTGPWWSWNPTGGPIAVDNGDSTWTFTFNPAPTANMEYLLVVDGVQENLVAANTISGNWSCTPITDYWSYANREWVVGSGNVSNVYGTCDSCVVAVSGCTDSTATNYNPLATVDDGSCTYCVYGCMDTTQFNYNPFATCDDGSCIPIIYGCTDSTAINYYAAANTNNGNCVYCTYGCTDPLATNYNPLATCDNGSCTYGTTCTSPVPTGLSVTELTHDRAKVNWLDANTSSCLVEMYRVQYREQGTTAWSTKTALGSGLCNFGLTTTSKRLWNLTPSTAYEYRVKAWYCSSSASTWSPIATFSTLDPCPNIDNFAVSTPTNTRATFTWTAPTAPYSFVRIKLRVDTTGSPWLTAGGFGVMYPALTRDKNGLVSGESYRASSRTWCNPLGGAHKALVWSPFIYWTQPSSIRIDGEGSAAITNLEVYPNPSRDIFNVSFVSDEVQNLDISITNVIGEAIYNSDLEQFVGQFTKEVSLATYPKGVYFLQITTDKGVVTKKLILQ